MSDFCVVMTTASSDEAVQRLIDKALGEKLAACVQAMPMTSHYVWKGKIVREAETLLLFKAKTADYPALEEAIHAVHDYETPQIIRLDMAAGLPAYLAWIAASTG
jgi:periplasmic divalent cation tolerance protein